METSKNYDYLREQVPEIEINYKNKVKPSERIKITTSKDCERVFRLLFDDSKIEWVEEMILLLLNRQNQVIGYYKISSGGTASSICDVKVIFSIALKGNASGIILAHNHPSGNLKPSQADINMTDKIKNAGKILDIELLDHIIITSENYYSFSDEGLIR